MTLSNRARYYFVIIGVLYLSVGFLQSWSLALTILNDGLIAAIMALGVNMMWGYAGLFNIGIAGFFSLGGLAVVLVSAPFSPEAWSAGSMQILFALVSGIAIVAAGVKTVQRAEAGWTRAVVLTGLAAAGITLFKFVYSPATERVASINPATAGNIGGLGLPVPLAWLVGAVFAAGAAWVVARISLKLRSDYLAIATLGIGQIIISVQKNEDWLDRGVKDIYDISHWPVPEAVALQQADWFVSMTQALGVDARSASTIFVNLCFAFMIGLVLAIILLLAELSLKSPWGRMMRAIRDNEISAGAMGKDVRKRHLQIFVLGSAVVGIAGALFVMFHGIFSPRSFDDLLRYTFLIWAMVILGGSGNNWGAVLGALVVMLIWMQAEFLGPLVLQFVTGPLSDGPLKAHLIDSAVQMRLPLVGIVLIAVLRFSPRGLIPERGAK
ncbi:branched-chain amino acid ABC transporter permease [Phaeovulum sp.]|uniref:branched-chain amino acid ABC transporter permease n=1 Tax=Phaeovulum sp. TaxID=2934796 RepID=UPI002ABAC414|nr:branched-chain amino acid ABC transporter permease [Phaeovulum sp.]MDZ4120228.1 branched-chain amino acid ABC transporter permease [Phaeovulum sp.]